MIKLSRNPREAAAQRVEAAFSTCKRRYGFAFWDRKRWWIADSNDRVYAVQDAAPGCASGLDFKRADLTLGRRR